MKERADAMVAGDEKIQEWLTWGMEKARSVEVNYTSLTVQKVSNLLEFAIKNDLSRTRALSLSLSLSLDRALESSQNLAPALYPELQQLSARLPDRKNKAEFKQWWQANGVTWREDLRKLAIQHRNIGHDWQFSEEQKALLRDYWQANKLLMQCLNSSYVLKGTRQKIEETLFLPIALCQDSI